MKLMQQFPPEGEGQVTLENWRRSPWNRWAYHHVRELLPTANIACRAGTTLPLDSGSTRIDLEGTVFETGAGYSTSLMDFLDQGSTDGFLVLGEDRILAEYYANGHALQTPHVIFSVSKSITGILAGIQAEQGFLDPDAPVTRYIPEAGGSAYADCSIRHLLDMTVSTAFEEDYLDPDGDVARYRRSTGWDPALPGEGLTDLRSYLLTMKRGQCEHGRVFHYVSPNTDMLGWILERTGGQSLASLLSGQLWQPLGAEQDAYITVDRLGAPRAAGGICMTLRDLARVGLLMVRNGQVNGHQVVPESWLGDIHTGGDQTAWQQGEFSELLPQGRYRSKWYQTGYVSGAYCAIGIHGQWIYCDPCASVVIVRQASQPLAVDDAYDMDFLRMCDQIASKAGSLE